MNGTKRCYVKKSLHICICKQRTSMKCLLKTGARQLKPGEDPRSVVICVHNWSENSARMMRNDEDIPIPRLSDPHVWRWHPAAADCIPSRSARFFVTFMNKGKKRVQTHPGTPSSSCHRPDALRYDLREIRHHRGNQRTNEIASKPDLCTRVRVPQASFTATFHSNSDQYMDD